MPRINVFLIVVMIALVAGACAGKPPRAEADAAENAFLAAKAAGPCAPLEYASAEKALAEARTLMREKKYEEAKRYFLVAENKSKEAQSAAANNKDCQKPEAAPAPAPLSVSATEPVALSELSGPQDIGFELKPVYFDFNSDELSGDSKLTLEQNAAWMKNFPDIKVVLEGNADKRGSTEYNLSLGERRAQAVRQYLAALQVNPDMLGVLSYGEERPILDAETEEAFAANRRVEFRKTR